LGNGLYQAEADFDSSVQAFFQRFCRRLVRLYVIFRETRSASMAVDIPSTITRNVAGVIARCCTRRVSVSDEARQIGRAWRCHRGMRAAEIQQQRSRGWFGFYQASQGTLRYFSS
jgi:hypothetical protein